MTSPTLLPPLAAEPVRGSSGDVSVQAEATSTGRHGTAESCRSDLRRQSGTPPTSMPLPQVEPSAPSASSAPSRSSRRYSLVPSKRWAELSRAFRRIFVCDALLAEPSPAAWYGPNHGIALEDSSGGEWRWYDISPVHDLQRQCDRVNAGGFSSFNAMNLRDGPAINAPLAVAATRWRDVMEYLFINDEPMVTASRMARLCRITVDGRARASPDALAELYPEFGELMRDGGNALLSIPDLPHIYAALTTAFASTCSSKWKIRSGVLERCLGRMPDTIQSGKSTCSSGFSKAGRDSEASSSGMAIGTDGTEAEQSENRSGELTTEELELVCKTISSVRQKACQQALRAMREAEATSNHEETESACNEVILLDTLAAEPFLVRAGARLHAGDPWRCMEDIRVYLWSSTRQGVVPTRHATAYWRMAEAFLLELDQRSQTMGALLEDDIFHCLVDEAESSLRLALRYGREGMAHGGAAQHLLQRIEAHRAARRTAAALLDAPLVLDTSVVDEGQDGAEPTPRDYALPWPIDLCAGLPDVALFGRTPTPPTSSSSIVGASSQEHDPLDLLFLDSRGPLDMIATLHCLAARASAYATRHAEHLHWKHRPKPVHVHLQMPAPERLAHTLLCLLIAKQVGTVVSSEDDKVARKPTGMTAPASSAAAAGAGAPAPTFTMEETRHDRFLAGLLTAVVFCRTLTAVQRAEVDRLLALLVFASMDLAWMRRAFPWLDLDDNRMSVFAAGTGNHSDGGENEGRGQGQRISSTAGDLHGAGDTSLSLDSSLPSQDAPDREAGRLLRRSRIDVATKLLANAGRVAGGASLVLFEVQQIWIGWLATNGGEARSAAGDIQDLAPDEGPPTRLDAAAVHTTARRLLLGPRAAALCPALDLAPGSHGLAGLTQRRLWALTGHLPTGSRDAGPAPVATCSDAERLSAAIASSESALLLDEDDPARRLIPPDPRARWRPMLEELASCEPHRWRLNPCALDPVSWAYDPRALADPFRAFSWRLRSDGGVPKAAGTASESGAAAGDTRSAPRGWPDSPSCLLEVADPPLPPLCGQQPPAIEIVWEQTMAELKALSAIFNSLEAAESARTQRPARTSDEYAVLGVQDSQRSAAQDSTFSDTFSRSTLFSATNGRGEVSPVRSVLRRRKRKTESSKERPPMIREQIALLRQRVDEEDDLENGIADEIPQRDIESELQALKRRHHEEGLDLQLRDYVTLASVRKREADWWGRGGASAAAYKDALEAGPNATWNPAPAACTPIRLRIRASAGTPWQVVRAASFRGLTFDAIDARGLLCSQVGLLGLCTWFDSVLKSTAHAYIQTRQCEELFQERLRTIVEANGGNLAGVDTTGVNNAAASAVAAQVPLRGPSVLGAAGAMWPHASSGSIMPTPPARKPVLSANGTARWPKPRKPMHPPPSRLMYAGDRSPSTMLPFPPSGGSPGTASPLSARQAVASLLPGCTSPTGQRGRTSPGGRVTSPWLPGRGSPGRSETPRLQTGVNVGVSSMEASGRLDSERVNAKDLSKAVRLDIYRSVAKVGKAEVKASMTSDMKRTTKSQAENAAQLSRPIPKAEPTPEIVVKAPDGDGPAWKRRLEQRMMPEPEPRPTAHKRSQPISEQRNRVFPPYTVESMLFEQLVHESVSTRVSASQMQYLLGVAVRAEPLWAEPALGRLGACALPVRHDFFPWDSTLEAIKVTSASWPCDPEKFDVYAKQAAPDVDAELLRRGYSVGKTYAESLAMFGRFWPVPSDREKAAALGPRLLRIRRLGCHPSLGLVPSGKCANAAFCSRTVAALDSVQVGVEGSFKCSQCDCAWYCSATCQALHKSAHSFECQALRSLRSAAGGFESRGLERTKRTLATLLEHVLAKQFSMVARPEDLVGCTALSDDLLSAIYGASHAVPPHKGTEIRADDSESEGSDVASDHTKRASIGRRAGSIRSSLINMEVNTAAKVLANTKLVEWSQMLIVPEDFEQWSVQLEAGHLEGLSGRRDSLDGRRGSVLDAARRASMTTNMRVSEFSHRGTLGRESIMTEAAAADSARRVPGGLFDVRQSHAHTAAGVVRLLLRWVGTTHRSPALREVIDDGFIFCLITGLCETRHFSKRRLTKHGVVSVLAHRMSLHVAASQQWRALAPSLAPPRQFQDGGLQGIECAQYSAYYAFLKPLRLPFARLRPLLPIVCLVWGHDAKNALMALPHAPETMVVPLAQSAQVESSTENVNTRKSFAITPKDSFRYRSNTSNPEENPENKIGMEEWIDPASNLYGSESSTLLTRPDRKGAKNLTRFLEVASEHLANIQLIDSVNLDVLTGKAVFLMYTSAVEAARTADTGADTCVLLLDAARGMQAVASPLPARELRRCAL